MYTVEYVYYGKHTHVRAFDDYASARKFWTYATYRMKGITRTELKINT